MLFEDKLAESFFTESTFVLHQRRWQLYSPSFVSIINQRFAPVKTLHLFVYFTFSITILIRVICRS